MPIFYLYTLTILGVVVGFLSGWGVAMLFMMLGYGAYSFLFGAITWVVLSFFGLLAGLSLFSR